MKLFKQTEAQITDLKQLNELAAQIKTLTVHKGTILHVGRMISTAILMTKGWTATEAYDMVKTIEQETE